MKTYASKKGINPFTFLKRNRKLHLVLSVLLTLAFLNLTVGCSYYKASEMTTSKEEYIAKINRINELNQYAIVHSDGQMWHLRDVNLDINTETLNGTIAPLSDRHTYKKPRKTKGANRYNTEKQSPLDEIHFQVTSKITPDYGSSVSIPFDSIKSISLNKRDGGTEVAYFFLGTVGVLVGAFLIILATKSSCPFAYVQTDTGWQFIGELYPGMITENMQKDDFLPLGTYNLSSDVFVVKVTNELREIQYTDALELIALEHPENVEVLLDDSGNSHTFSQIQAPTRVTLDDFSEATEVALYKDEVPYAFNNVNNDITEARRYVEVEFDVPNQNADAKLYLRAKNSLWLDYIFGEFNKKFGTRYSEFQKQQQKRTGAESRQWIHDQHIPLSVYVQTDNRWELITSINTVGPLKYRNLVVPIDAKYFGKEKVKIKLETGFMFWEVDYVGIDFTPNMELKKLELSPKTAFDQEGNLVTKLVASTDKTYLVQPNIGDEVIVTFENETLSHGTHSMFLKNRGYYNYKRDFSGTPDIQTLKQFKEKEQFTLYSMMEYQSLMEYQTTSNTAQNAN